MWLKILYILVLTLTYLAASRWMSRLIFGSSAASRSRPARVQYVNKTIGIALAVIYLVGLSLVLGIEYGQVTIFLSSAFAVLGIALFAQWSILSNLTASLIIFFGFPYRIGDRVRVLEKEDSVVGTIEEISLFTLQIRDLDGNLATFPNNLFLQKVVVKIEQPAQKEEVAPLHD